MSTRWSFYTPLDHKTVQAVIIPEMTGRADFAIYEKLKPRIEAGTVVAEDVKAALLELLNEHGLYATRVEIRCERPLSP